MDRTALIAGATGLVGRHLLQRLLDDPDYGNVIALTRRALDVPHPKLAEGIVDFEHLDDLALPHVDDVFCCLGTTIRATGTRDAFRQVDHVYPMLVADQGLRAGATQFLFVSAMGADPGSRVFYSRVKGELEADAAKLPYRTVVAFRPALIAGDRAEWRPGERAALALLMPLRLLLPRKLRPVEADRVAAAMHAFAKRERAGHFVVLSDDIARGVAQLAPA